MHYDTSQELICINCIHWNPINEGRVGVCTHEADPDEEFDAETAQRDTCPHCTLRNLNIKF